MKRLLPSLSVILAMCSIINLSLSVFASDALENSEGAFLMRQPTENPSTDAFMASDPFVCLIPEDGVFLPCHANLIEDFIPFQRQVQSVITNTKCVNDEAAGYPCRGVDLMAYLSLDEFGNAGGSASDIWGWTNPNSGQEIVILTLQDRTSFVDITDPTDPQILAHLMIPNSATTSFWRDVKTYESYAYIVGDISKNFGMQIFDLDRLAGITETVVLTADNHYTSTGSTHNITINEESGLAALVGISTGLERCGGGMHLLDLAVNPLDPAFLGCVSEDGYVHDSQCVIYHGPDERYVSQEICFNFNESKLTIVDVTDRGNPTELSVTEYENSAYTHQGWVGPDHRYLLLDDESDERVNDLNTTTYIWDIQDLHQPDLIESHMATTQASDHNQYIYKGYSFQANYRAGLRILDVVNVFEGELEEVAYFDVFPADDESNYNGAWSVYPYFESGLVAISGIESGLFIVRPTTLKDHRIKIEPSPSISVSVGSSHSFTFSVQTLGLPDTYTLTLDSDGWETDQLKGLSVTGSPTETLDIPINITIPLTASESMSVTMIIESANRPDYTETVSKQLNLLIEPNINVLIEPLNTVFDQSGLAAQSVLVTNQSSQPEKFEISAQSNPWQISPAMIETPLLEVGESFLAKFHIEIGDGIESTHMFTVTSAVDFSVLDKQDLILNLQTAAETRLSVEGTVSPDPKLNAIITLTNTGDYTDSYSISFDPMIISGTVDTGFIPSNETIELRYQMNVIGNGVIESDLIILSNRSGNEVDRIRLEHQFYTAYLPLTRAATR
ncbi:MAG: choice-of-anchor B family protein [Chloroflexota bacterium]